MSAPFDPWAPCPACRGQGVATRVVGRGSEHSHVCGDCGATGLARLRDPQGDGAMRFEAASGTVPSRYYRLAEGLLDDLTLTRTGGDYKRRVAAWIRAFEVFVTPPAETEPESPS